MNGRDYYVYGWFNLDWGVYFYIGRGKGDRYKSLAGRSKVFRTIVNLWNCEPLILKDELTLEESEFLEKDRKRYLLFTAGHPILDGEPSDLRAMAQAEGIRRAKENGTHFGRKEKRPENFAEVLKKQKTGEISLKEALELTGIGRTRWYELAREATVC